VTSGALAAVLLAATATDRVDPSEVRQPWGVVEGLTQFRGNTTHTFYGTGPMPSRPRVLWRFPKDEPMCSISKVGQTDKLWCGTGWTGQPVVYERADGVTEIIFGAFDKRIHFLDAASGRRLRADFPANDIFKGSVSLDPDGYPLLYAGARDNRLRVIALDRPRPRQLFALRSGDYRGIYDNDWDGNPSVVGGVLFEGGENGILFAVDLARGYDERGKVRVEPEVLATVPGWTRDLVRRAGDHKANIESSVAILGDRLYFTNSLGRVVGLDISRIREGVAPVVFDFWAGDDIDASIVIDETGMLYVAAELERDLPRAAEVRQLFKLDPTRPDDPVVWSVPAPAMPGDPKGGGLWSTPALGDGVIYATSQSGYLFVVDTTSGKVVWSEFIARKLWSSPALVDGKLLVASCGKRNLHLYDVREPRRPVSLWRMKLGKSACIDSTPAVWRGRIYIGTWEGFVYAVGDAPALAGVTP
jgi:hypothetical protein